MRIAIYGGSFNPVHLGHLAIAEEAAVNFGYDKILFVPNFIPPHKMLSATVSPVSRLAMLEAAVRGNPKFEIEPCEIQRGGVSYTIDTVKFLEMKYRGRLEGKTGLIMGQEIAAEFEKWKSPDEIAELCDIIIARRLNLGDKRAAGVENRPRGSYLGGVDSHGQFMKIGRNSFKWPYKELNNIIIPVSSTDIREKISKGRGWRYYVPEAVYNYIVANRLYGYKQ